MQLPKLPGLEALGSDFLQRYVQMVTENEWPAAGPLVVMYRESGFNPRAQLTTTDTKTGQRGLCLELGSPKNCAVGLLQWNASGSKASGLDGTRDALREIVRMSAVEQLDLVELYFRAAGVQHYNNPADFYLVTFGRVDAVGKPDSFPLARSMAVGGTSQEDKIYQANKALDFDGDGVITAGDLRIMWEGGLGAARGQTIEVAYDPTPVRKGGAGGVLVALGITSIAALIFRGTLKGR